MASTRLVAARLATKTLGEATMLPTMNTIRALSRIRPLSMTNRNGGGVVIPVFGTSSSSRFPFSTNASLSSSTPSDPDSSYSDSDPPRPKLLSHKELLQQDFSKMTIEQLKETSDIPGWHLIHSPPRSYPRGSLVGKVVSTKMQKTINVAVDRYKVVRKIQYRVRFTRKFMAHDENEVANMGDTVLIVPCHKISKHKHFMLTEIIRTKDQL
ncbi:hypothetical protein ACA910_014487 [Epithemia clementina (nom. ined.)]